MRTGDKEIKMKRRQYKNIILDNCVYLKKIKVLIPEEVIYFQEDLKKEFYKIEKFYARFFRIEDFLNNLTVKFHIKTRLTKIGDFDCYDARLKGPAINIYTIQDKYFSNTLGSLLAHEFAHFIDWRLGNIEKSYDKTINKNSKESQLAQKFLSLQEIQPAPIPFGGPSISSQNSNCELYARYCEEYFEYCTDYENFYKKHDYNKNGTFVRASDFVEKLLEPVKEYIGVDESDFSFLKEESVLIDGILYSKDKKVLIKYQDKTGVSSFKVPDEVEIIGEWAFDQAENLTELQIGDGVKIIAPHAFRLCSSLKKISGGKNVLFIGYMAFSFCKALEEVKDFSSLIYISSLAFAVCSKLRVFNFPKSLMLVEKDAFNKKDCAFDLDQINDLLFKRFIR